MLPLEYLPLPHLTATTQAFFRTAYGILLIGTLLLALPHVHRFFLSERWKGYAQSSPAVNLIQNPWVLPFVLISWFLSGLGIVLDRWTVAASLVNLIFCWYFFVWMRWRGILRGSGAPGFMTYWLGGALFLTEVALRFAPNLYPFVLWVIQCDLAFIIFTSGFYKFRAGFLRNEGMEYGLANPEWGHWWRFYKGLRPNHWIFKIYDQLAWSGQIVAALLMLIPATRPWGSLLLIASFLVIIVNIRLGFLSEMMILSGVLFFEPGSPGDRIITQWVAPFLSLTPSPRAGSGILNTFLAGGLGVYLFLLPFAYAGLYYNFYGRKTLPPPWQKALEKYTNFFGMIIWRVFTVDLINFFIQIYRAPKEKPNERVLLSEWGRLTNLRFNHVAESITVTSLFTTLKYYPNNPKLFWERLLRYARSLPCRPGDQFLFEYVRLLKGEDGFHFRPATEFIVDPSRNTVRERVLDPQFSTKAAARVSPVHEGAAPGSYRPR